jgi:hypothetical protein
MTIKQLRAAFGNQFGHTKMLKYIERPLRPGPDRVRSLLHWRIVELATSHTFHKKDQTGILPRFRALS